ncbi:MAG: GNAT family N-acetyltransferase [Flavobacterium sp.]
MQPVFQTKTFAELTTLELYQILTLRSEVFVVEQNCIYQDIDGKDIKAWHVLMQYEKELVGYVRLFQAGDYFDKASIGRVVVSPKHRGKQFGYALMQFAIKEITTIFKTNEIEISAQCYLQKFYESLGFQTTGVTYLEDDIPHVRMIALLK